APPPSADATAGDMMAATLDDVHTRFRTMGIELTRIPDYLATVWWQTEVLLPGSALLRLVGALIGFLAGGIGAHLLFLYAARSWRAHFAVLNLATPRQRLSAVCERLLFGILVIAVSAAGSLGAFLLFVWPPLTGS